MHGGAGLNPTLGRLRVEGPSLLPATAPQQVPVSKQKSRVWVAAQDCRIQRWEELRTAGFKSSLCRRTQPGLKFINLSKPLKQHCTWDNFISSLTQQANPSLRSWHDCTVRIHQEIHLQGSYKWPAAAVVSTLEITMQILRSPPLTAIVSQDSECSHLQAQHSGNWSRRIVQAGWTLLSDLIKSQNKANMNLSLSGVCVLSFYTVPLLAFVYLLPHCTCN